MMKVLKIFLFFFFLISGLISAAGLDRVSVHSERLSGLDLANRGQAIPYHSLTPSLAANVEDLPISESVSPSRFYQDYSDLYPIADSTWVAVWTDDRLGTQKIFLQKFDVDGSPIGDNTLITGSAFGHNYADARLAVDTLGRVYLFYRDQTGGMIFGSRYNDDLSVDLPEYLVNDTGQNSFGGPFDFDIYPDGRLVVVWENYASTGSSIQMSIFDNNGNRVLTPTAVNEGGDEANNWVPDVAVRPGGGFLVCWEDNRNSTADIYARQFNGNGDVISGDMALVAPPASLSDQYLPGVVYSPLYGYVIAWVDLRDSHEIYFQQYNPSTGIVGENRLLSVKDSQIENWDVSLSVSPGGKLLAVWAAFGQQSKILGRRFDSVLNPIGDPQKLNLSGLEQRWRPIAAFSEENRIGAAWTEFIGNDDNIGFMLFDTSWTRQMAAELILNDDSAGAVSADPKIINLSNWYNLIVFADQRNDDGDIYSQVVTNGGGKIGLNRRVNQDVGSNLQSEPAATAAGEKALIVWVDGRAVTGFSGQRIYGRYCNIYGDFIDDEFMISDSAQYTVKAEPRTAMAADGQTLVAWFDKGDGTGQVYGRWLSADGLFESGTFLISDTAVNTQTGALQVTVDSLNRFYVVWMNYDSTPEILVKWFNADRSEGDTFSSGSGVTGVDISEMAATVSGAGDIYVLWTGLDGDYYKLYLMVLSNTGVIITTPFEITDVSEIDPATPALAVDENGYATAIWTDNRDGYTAAYYQLFNNGLTPMNANQRVSAVVTEFMRAPAIDAVYGRAWFSWADPRENGFNIYAANYLYLATDVDDDDTDDPVLPREFSLAQNYPNPFNPTTVIDFSLSKQSEIELTVYNMLGQRVKILAYGKYSAGKHQVVWDGTDSGHSRVASGIYLYRLTGEGFSEEKKMILIK